MKLELNSMPDGCKAAVVENSQTIYAEPAMVRIIGQAVCGGRQVEATGEYYVPSGFFNGSDDRVRARNDVNSDITNMLTAMCIDCPNRDRSGDTFKS